MTEYIITFMIVQHNMQIDDIIKPICDQEGKLVLPKYAIRMVRLASQTNHQSDTLPLDHPVPQKRIFKVFKVKSQASNLLVCDILISEQLSLFLREQP